MRYLMALSILATQLAFASANQERGVVDFFKNILGTHSLRTVQSNVDGACSRISIYAGEGRFPKSGLSIPVLDFGRIHTGVFQFFDYSDSVGERYRVSIKGNTIKLYRRESLMVTMGSFRKTELTITKAGENITSFKYDYHYYVKTIYGDILEDRDTAICASR